MELKTAQIIMMTKQPQNFGDFNTHREEINTFMSLYSGTPIEYYSTKSGRECIDNVVFEVLCDYINTCNKPSVILRGIKSTIALWEYENKEIDETEAILTALSLTEVLKKNPTTDEYEYINGYTEENTKVLTPEDF